MTDQSTGVDATPTSATPSSTPAYTPAPSVAYKTPVASLILLWLFIIGIIAALSYGALYALRYFEQQTSTINSLREQLDQQSVASETRYQVLEDTLEKELLQQQTELQTHLNELAEQLDSSNARILALSSVNRDDWKLQEAQYLLRLADQRLLLEKDSQNALALAISADDVLREVNQADLVSVRKSLAEEISVLKMAGIIDREGIFLRLSALSTQIDAIPFIEPLGQQPLVLLEEEINPNETWREKLSRYALGVLNRLSAYVRVRDHGQTINAVLPPEEQRFLQQNLRLMLEQAQVALLRNEKGIYRESLIKAQNWINQYFSLNAQARAVLDELQSLLNEEIAPELTNFTNTSAALAEYIEKREKMAAARRGVRP